MLPGLFFLKISAIALLNRTPAPLYRSLTQISWEIRINHASALIITLLGLTL